MSATAAASAALPARVPGRVAPATALFVATSFLAAFLLFLIQPIVGKMILPRFGGVPAVWNTCQVFFQFALLAGYGYAHLATARLGVRRQIALHLLILVLPVLVLPVALPRGWDTSDGRSPIPTLLGLLAVSVGLPFLVISTTAPLLQRWFAENARGSDPYFLYAASNLGSLAALIGYPLVIEPALSLRQQSLLWSAGFGVLAVAIAVCGMIVRSATPRDPLPDERPPEPEPLTWPTRLHWVALAFVPSSLLLGVTTHVTTDLAPIPLLWVAPLALYLLSFVIAFARPPRWVAGVASGVAAGTLLLLLATYLGRWPTLGAHLLFFFAAVVALHAELARRRPPAAQLTEFYLWMSVGGVLGGVANGIAAPLLLNDYYEYQVAMVLALMLMPSPWPSTDRRPFVWVDGVLPVAVGVVAAFVFFETQSTRTQWVASVACAAFVRRPIRLALGVAVLFVLLESFSAPQTRVLHQSRNFYGVLRVIDLPELKVHRLQHGTTTHGVQILDELRPVRRLPLAYYFPTGPIGQVFMLAAQRGHHPPVAVVGLGAGSLATYAEDGQEVAFFEIDPDVVRVAQNPDYFTFLSESRGNLRFVLGDARLTLAREPARHFGLIVIDAFSSDAIPTHLLTAEALDAYLDKLADNGLIAFHVSNKYLDLPPVIAALARNRGLLAYTQNDDTLDAREARRGKLGSEWVLVARSQEALQVVLAPAPPDAQQDLKAFAQLARQWKPLTAPPGAALWTDDYTNVLGAIRFGR